MYKCGDNNFAAAPTVLLAIVPTSKTATLKFFARDYPYMDC